MKRLLSTTTALAIALAPIPTIPARAQTLQEDGSVVAPDGTVLCTPTAEEPCNLKKIKKAYKKQQAAAAPEEAAPADDAAAAEAAAAEAAAAEAAEAAKKAERKAAKKAEEEAAAAQKAAEEAAAAEAAAAQKAADEAAAAEAAQKAADEAAAAEAAQKAADEAAAAEAAAAQTAAEEAAAAEAAAAEAAATEAAAAAASETTAEPAAEPAEAPAEEPAAEEPATEEPAAEAPVAEEPAAEEPAAEEPVAEEPAAEEPAADTPVTEEPVTEEPAAEEPAADPAASGETGAAAEPAAEPEATTTEEVVVDPANDASVDAVAPSEESAEAVAEILAQPAEEDGTEAPVAAAAEAASTDAPAAEEATVTETVLTEDDARTSDEDFATTSSGAKNDKKKKKKDNDNDDELSDLQKFGLVALGAVAVGTYLNNRNKVVSNTGDRVVVERDDGSYAVYKDDDALLRQPGSTVKTETFTDGSSRTTVVRADGTQIVTVRDATGRVLRRAAFDKNGREIVLIDDLVPETRVDVTTLPKPKPVTISAQDNDAALAAALRAAELEDLGRSFSLRQIRDIPQVRALAATIDVDSITFDTGSAAITASEAKKLSALGRFISGMIAENPGEMFLIEGHTDAVGSAASNLTLSDRRAESVALALTEYYDVPPENLVVQGYGESELLVQSQGDERANRRVAARIITPLLRPAAQ